MKSTAVVCILAALCTCQAVRAKSVDVSGQPELNVTVLNLRLLLPEIDIQVEYFNFDAYLDLHLQLSLTSQKAFVELNLLKKQVQMAEQKGKDVQPCKEYLNENALHYKQQYKNTAKYCAKNFQHMIAQAEASFVEVYTAGENLLKELEQTNCEESTDVELCKSTAATKVADIETRYAAALTQTSDDRTQALRLLEECLLNIVDSVTLQTVQLRANASDCLEDL
ncbi:hypothetical protein KM043_018617 [Ampulex compressa]|nr:hypothetical protein KM043_018617 [Ampulex compressa]